MRCLSGERVAEGYEVEVELSIFFYFLVFKFVKSSFWVILVYFDILGIDQIVKYLFFTFSFFLNHVIIFNFRPRESVKNILYFLGFTYFIKILYFFK